MPRLSARSLNRSTFRRAVRLPCQVVRERDFRLVGELAFDLSTDGMLATVNRPVLTGEPVFVAFKSARLGRWFDAEATVARVVHARRAGDIGHAVGLEFYGTTARFKRELFESLRRLPPPVPTRAPSSLAKPLLSPCFAEVDGELRVLP